MPAKKKDVKHDEPVFVDSEGVFIHEAEQARYSGGVRTLTSGVLPASMIANNPSLASVINNINNNNGGGMFSGEVDKAMQGGSNKGNSPAKKNKNKSTAAPASSTGHNSGDNKVGNAASAHLAADGGNSNININKGNDGAGNVFGLDNVLRFRHGTGTYISPELRYCGEWKEDVMHGNGTLEFKMSGSMYTGEFVNGMFCGHGKYVWADGSCYDGLWANNKMHGQGTFTDEHGQI